MSRFARDRRVFFFEEPVFDDGRAHLRVSECPKTGVRVHTPVLPHGLSQSQINEHLAEFLHSTIERNRIGDYIGWYYTPMALEFSAALKPALTVYDCMDELSAFAGAPPAMRINEATLFSRSDLVFTGGASLFEAKRRQNQSVHLFPSSVDIAHFSYARGLKQDPDDQGAIPHPRIGYAGVIDERMDLDLLRQVAAERPDWQLIFVGPVVKIQPTMLPLAKNLHYLGIKQYADLPSYLAGWDVAMLPFALNESTRFISPTKTPEYLAAGLPVISTPIRDVVNPYGHLGFVQIASSTGEFVRTAEDLLRSPISVELRKKIDRYLAQSSWDKTWLEMNKLMENKFAVKHPPAASHPVLAPAASIAAKGTANV